MRLGEFISLLRFDVLIYIEIENHCLHPSYTGKATDFPKWAFHGAYYDSEIFNMYMDKGVLIIQARTKNAF